jgi:hypothetical protein
MIKKLFGILLAILIISFFTRNNIRYVRDIAPEVLKSPIQSPVRSPDGREFVKGSYRYKLAVVCDYTISGLVVSKRDYRMFSIYQSDNMFPFDICLIWGNNVKSGVFRNRALKFSQDCRWCNAQWWGNLDFNFSELSNNHLLIDKKDIESTVKGLVAGDQVTITGKLVNVKAELIAKAGQYDSQTLAWTSSTSRTDSGAGACEVIYVEGIQVLRPANMFSKIVYIVSLYGLLAVVLWGVVKFII